MGPPRGNRIRPTLPLGRAVGLARIRQQSVGYSTPMDIAIAGGHGKVARRLARLLVARGDRVRALIRNPGHADDLRADGSEPVVCDLETDGVDEVVAAIEGADAVVFAAGAGAGSGA